MLGTLPETVKFKIYFIIGNAITKWGRSEGQNYFDALKRTATSLEKAKFDLENNITADWVAMDIRQAMYDLGTITGDISTDDLLGNIFSKFCIGK